MATRAVHSHPILVPRAGYWFEGSDGCWHTKLERTRVERVDGRACRSRQMTAGAFWRAGGLTAWQGWTRDQGAARPFWLSPWAGWTRAGCQSAAADTRCAWKLDDAGCGLDTDAEGGLTGE
ncbi:hypothetical protein AURDEDRAFT_117001 [Auricularia subglabra TFB-10046 SS5]|nr:hypothetical protein AURDEDRAFT_117001 [Auricularia subglabra TFB-10046 SS5]